MEKSKREIANYTFYNGDVALTEWMLQNLNIGYWKMSNHSPLQNWND